jgi:hypothetical protein
MRAHALNNPFIGHVDVSVRLRCDDYMLNTNSMTACEVLEDAQKKGEGSAADTQGRVEGGASESETR